MKKFWMVLLALSFITLVACSSNEDKDTNTSNESADEKTEEVEKEESTDTEGEENSESSKKPEYDESKATNNIMKKEADGLLSTIEMKHADDVLLEQNQVTEGEYSTLGVKDKKEAQEKVKEFGDEEKYKDQEGVEYSVEFNDDTFIETFKVDYTVADLSVVSSLPDSGTESQFVSYELSVDNFKKQGYYLEGEESSEVFLLEQEGYIYEVSVLQDGNNKILKQTTYNEQSYESLGLADKKAAEEQFKDITKNYEELNKLDGVNFDMKFEDDKFTVEGVMDYEKVKDLDKVLQLMGIEQVDESAKEEARNYTEIAMALLGSGLEHVETKK